MFNHIFASVYADYTGFNVSIVEVDNINLDGKFKLLKSINSNRLSIEGITEAIEPFILKEVTDTRFIGIYINQNRLVAEHVWKSLGCEGGYLPPPRDIDTALCNIALKINSGNLLVASELSGLIQADLQGTELDKVPLRIAALAQFSEHWGAFKRGKPQERASRVY